MSKHLPDVPVETCDFIKEGAPIRPEPESLNWRPEAKFHEYGARIEGAFRRYFHRVEPTQTEDSYQILACHANVISITWIGIRPSGRVTVYSIGDIGHMPPDVLTTT